MKHGEADHLQFLKKMEGNLHVATCVAMSRFNKALAKIILAVVIPAREPHGRAQKLLATKRGGAQRQVTVASGAWLDEVAELAFLTQDHGKLKDIGFRASAEEPCGPLGEEDEEKQLADYMFTFTTHLIAQRVMKYLMYAFGLPFKFAHVLRDGDHEVAKALTALQVWWHILVKAEALAHDDSLVASVLKELVWPAMQ